jgi:hypothetical protein
MKWASRDGCKKAKKSHKEHSQKQGHFSKGKGPFQVIPPANYASGRGQLVRKRDGTELASS